MDFPLLRTFEVDSIFVDFLNKKFYDYVGEFGLDYDFTAFKSNTGGHTKNLVYWENSEYQNFVTETLIDLVSNELILSRDRIQIHFSHFLDYNGDGWIETHNHVHAEDFVLFVYMNDCDTGHTVFYLNNEEEFRERTLTKIKPTSGLCALFSSSLFHSGDYTNESKRLFVVGIRVNLE